ncbi:cistern family PEP-CTERM protein [Sphingomonas sp. 1P06PA]|uniref:cistern family PEP-CTERM protein n=1 Tax=Sphingomonas sp. 1P06PA TaxID=554121 RepID=UPI0039A5A3F9
MKWSGFGASGARRQTCYGQRGQSISAANVSAAKEWGTDAAHGPAGGSVEDSKGRFLIKSDIARRLQAENPDRTENEIESVIAECFGSITTHLATNGRVELRGFGSFSTCYRAPWAGRTPLRSFEVERKRSPIFRCSKVLLERLNETFLETVAESVPTPNVRNRDGRQACACGSLDLPGRLISGEVAMNLFRFALVGALLTSVSPAMAAITVSAANIGDPIIYRYAGFETPDGSGGTIGGLAAQTTFTLSSIANGVFTFNYSVDNISHGQVTGSRVSVFGFTTSGAVDSQTTVSGATFDRIGHDSNVANLTGSDDGRVCFRAGGGGAQCTGGGGDGVAISDDPATGTFSLTYAPGTTSITLDRFFVRYQSITGVPGITSATGSGVFGAAVPEPASWALMIGGFGLTGAALRRRKLALA